MEFTPGGVATQITVAKANESLEIIASDDVSRRPCAMRATSAARTATSASRAVGVRHAPSR